MRVAEFCTQKADGFTETEDVSGMLQSFEKLRGLLVVKLKYWRFC